MPGTKPSTVCFRKGSRADASSKTDKPREACGVFGVFDHPDASNLTYLGLHSLQHRGQESAGIVSAGADGLHSHRGMGLVADVFGRRSVLRRLIGTSAIGHVRYATTGESTIENAQPFTVECREGAIAVAHNGNIVNSLRIRRHLEQDGAIFQSTIDTENLFHLLVRQAGRDFEARLAASLAHLQGAYSMVILTETGMYAARDPFGLRPLVLGQLNGAHVLASESCALDFIGAKYVREVKPGEIISIDRHGLRSMCPDNLSSSRTAACVFELVYFARPDSVVFGRSVWESRKAMGRLLATECPVPADIVVPVPDSGIAAAIGYSNQTGIPFDLGLVRSHYVGRTFIEPEQSIRNFGVKLKLSPVRAAVVGKRVALVDDSLVRGTTSRKIVELLRGAGAAEVHLRIASPPTIGPCYFGVDTPSREELIATTHGIAEIRSYVTADTVAYLSLDSLREAVRNGDDGFCDGCFSNDYPLPVSSRTPSHTKRLFEA